MDNRIEQYGLSGKHEFGDDTHERIRKKPKPGGGGSGSSKKRRGNRVRESGKGDSQDSSLSGEDIEKKFNKKTADENKNLAEETLDHGMEPVAEGKEISEATVEPDIDPREEELADKVAKAIEKSLKKEKVSKKDKKPAREKAEAQLAKEEQSKALGKPMGSAERESLEATIYGTNSIRELGNLEDSLKDEIKNNPHFRSILEKQRTYLFSKNNENAVSETTGEAKDIETENLDSKIVTEEKQKLISALGGRMSAEKIKQLGERIQRQERRGFLGNRVEETKAAYQEIMDEAEAAKMIKKGSKVEAVVRKKDPRIEEVFQNDSAGKQDAELEKKRAFAEKKVKTMSEQEVSRALDSIVIVLTETDAKLTETQKEVMRKHRDQFDAKMKEAKDSDESIRELARRIVLDNYVLPEEEALRLFKDNEHNTRVLNEEMDRIRTEGVEETIESDYNVNAEEQSEQTRKKIAEAEHSVAEASKKLEKLRALFAENIDLKKQAIERNKLRG